MMRRLTSRPEAVVPGPHVHVEQIARVGSAQAVAHSVVAGEVRGALGGRQQVVGGQGVRRVRELHVAHLRSQLLRPRERSVEGVEHAGFDALAGELGRHAEPHAVQALGGGRGSIGSGNAREVASPGVAADHVTKHQRRGRRHRA